MRYDIDCDICLTKRNYEKLLKLFELHNGTIGNLTYDTNGYKDPNGCRWIFNKKYLHLETIFPESFVCHTKLVKTKRKL